MQVTLAAAEAEEANALQATRAAMAARAAAAQAEKKLLQSKAASARCRASKPPLCQIRPSLDCHQKQQSACPAPIARRMRADLAAAEYERQKAQSEADVQEAETLAAQQATAASLAAAAEAQQMLIAERGASKR